MSINITNSTKNIYIDKSPNCTAKILSITNNGILTLKFNQKMITDFNFSMINKTNTNIQILPSL